MNQDDTCNKEIEFICPACKQSLFLEENIDQLICPFCNNEITLNKKEAYPSSPKKKDKIPRTLPDGKRNSVRIWIILLALSMIVSFFMYWGSAPFGDDLKTIAFQKFLGIKIYISDAYLGKIIHIHYAYCILAVLAMILSLLFYKRSRITKILIVLISLFLFVYGQLAMIDHLNHNLKIEKGLITFLISSFFALLSSLALPLKKGLPTSTP